MQTPPAPAYRQDESAGAAARSLAVRCRPHRFADVVGQRHVVVPVSTALAAGKLPQQLLFSGGSGLGKTTVARIVAAALLCENPVRTAGIDACGDCETCTDIAAGTHVDVIELDAASNGGVDKIRELAARAHLAPMRASKRVYIVDEAHGLTAAGGQAFLKLLEEPPPHVVFLLATTDPDKMLHTNRSRCAEFELLPPATDLVVAHLIAVAAREGVAIDTHAASAVVAASDKDLGVRGALVTLDKVLPVLHAGSVTADMLAELLGEPPASVVDALVAAASANDPVTAIALFTELRHRFPVRKIVERIADRCVADLVAVCSSPTWSTAAFEAAQYRCSAFARALSAGSEIAAVAAIAEVVASGPINVVAASTVPHSHTPASVTPASVTPASVDTVELSVQSAHAENAPASTGQQAYSATELLHEIIAAVSTQSRVAAAVLRAGKVSLADTELIVELPPAAIERLAASTDRIAAAASAAGVQLVLRPTVD